MESRESSSSQSTPPFNRDTTPAGSSSTAEDDAVLSVSAALAKDAALHFQSRRFVDCLAVLYQLKQKKEDDTKVLHNIAIAEYFRDGCSNPRKLLEVLNNVKKKSELLAKASGEQAEINAANKVTSGSKGSGTPQQVSASNSSSLVFMDEFDPAVATLNIATIWFHLHEYTKALTVLEPLYHNIEPIDETTALHVCLLLLDVALVCQDASKSADILIYLEKAYGISCSSLGDNGSATQQQSTNPATKPSSLTTSSSAIDSSNADLASSGTALVNSLSRTSSLSEETLEYDTMFSLDNLTRPSGLSSSTDISKTQTNNKSMSSMDLKLKLQLYKVRFLILTRNLKLAKREIKLSMNIGGKDSPTALLLKSELEYANGKYPKAMKLLTAANKITETGNLNIFNNLGCIYYRMGKYHTSSVFFCKALNISSSLQREKLLKLVTFSQDKSVLITYNCGVQYLASGKPFLAARCFQKATSVFYNVPRLWVRVAECCLMALEKGLLNSVDRSEITVYVIGKGKWRHLGIEYGNSRFGYVESSNDQPNLSLSLAKQCLVNALNLLESSDNNCLKSSLPSSFCLDENEASGVKEQEIMHDSMSHFEDIRRRENQIIRQAILADLAYTELELENPEKALISAKSLLEIPDCSKIYTFLGRVYAAEALCLMNKLIEAAEFLSTFFSVESKIEVPFSLEDYELWPVEKNSDKNSDCKEKSKEPKELEVVFLKPEEAQGALYANFAAVFAAQGEIERARDFMAKALKLVPNSPEATLTAVYVDLRLGKTEEAVKKLKECSRVKFLPSRVQLNKA